MPRKGYTWVFDPQSGGVSIPKSLREEIRKKIISEFDKQGLSENKRIDVRFKAQFCYVDAWEGDDIFPVHLFRLRYIASRNGWSVAFYAYSSEKYEPCFFSSGDELGSPQQAVDLARVYLS